MTAQRQGLCFKLLKFLTTFLSCPLVYSNFLDSPRPISSEGKEVMENHFLPPLTCSHQVQGSREHHIMRSKEDTAGWPLSRAQLPGHSAKCVSYTQGGLILRPRRFWMMDFFLLMRHVVFQKTSSACLSLPALSLMHPGQSAHSGMDPLPLWACRSMS